MRHETRDEKALQNSLIFGILNKKWSNLLFFSKQILTK